MRSSSRAALQQVVVGLVEHPDLGDEHDAGVTTAREQHPIGVQPKLIRVSHPRSPLVATRMVVGPNAILPNEVGAPGEETRIELEALASKLRYAGSELATRSTSRVVVTLGEPWPVLD